MLTIAVLLVPVMVLAIVALAGFTGCHFAPGVAGNNAPTINSVTPASGSPYGGDAVAIQGSNFANSDSVAFGGTAATAVNASSDGTTITCNTPAHASGIVDVVVTSGSQSGTLTQGFTYDGVTQLGTVTAAASPGASQVSVTLPESPADPDNNPDKLIVVAVQWADTTVGISVAGAAFQQVEIDDLTPQRVGIFYAQKVQLPVTVVATFSPATNREANLFASAYAFTNGGAPGAHMFATDGTGDSGTLAHLTLPGNAFSPLDLVYSFVVARGPGEAVAGALAPGTTPTFTAEAGQGTAVMVQDHVVQDTDVANGQIDVTATNTSGPSNSHWYIFGMHVPHA